MVQNRLKVTRRKRRPSDIHSDFNEYVALATVSQRSGLIDEISQRLRLRRRGGYQGVDVFNVLLGFFSGSRKGGLKGWLADAQRYAGELGAITGRATLPTQASFSRALGSVEAKQAHDFSAWLLGCETPEVSALMNTPAAQYRDSHGQGWHIVDYDPTQQPHRHRGLPEGDDLPEPVRISDSMSAAGHPGRKRGTHVTSHALLQHAGTGRWLACHPYRGSTAPQSHRIAAAWRVRQVASDTGIAPERFILRADGGIAGVPFMAACQEAGVRVLTRVLGLGLYGKLEVLERLASDGWTEVPDSRSGPKRHAIDLGTMTLNAGRQTESAVRSVAVRVVASRYRVDKKKRGVGHVIGDWCYELFAADLPTDAFPASEVVALYYGRSQIENRIGQLQLDGGRIRTWSTHLPGQELALCVALHLWNQRTTLGAVGLKCLGAPDAQLPRVSEPVPPLPLGESPLVGWDEAEPERQARTAVVADAGTVVRPDDLDDAARHVLLESAPWEAKARKMGPGWSAAPDGPGVVCPEGALLAPEVLKPSGRGGITVGIRAPRGVCTSCPQLAACTGANSANPYFRRAGTLTLAASTVLQIIGNTSAAPSADPGAESTGTGSPDIGQLPPPDTEATAGPWAVAAPAMNIRAIGRRWREAIRTARHVITVRTPPEPEVTATPYMHIPAPGARQCRRRTWEARIAERALPDKAAVEVHTTGNDTLVHLLEAVLAIQSA